MCLPWKLNSDPQCSPFDRDPNIDRAAWCDMLQKKSVCATNKYNSVARVQYSLAGILDRATCLYEKHLSMCLFVCEVNSSNGTPLFLFPFCN